MAKIHLTKDQLDRMSGDELTNLLLRAEKIEATAVVRRKDGSIRYDRPELSGQYGEHFLSEDKADG